MAYHVVLLDDFRATQLTTGGPGRPAKYHEETKSVSFRVPLSLLREGRAKFEESGVNMTELFAYHYLNFVRQPIEATHLLLNYYRAKFGPIEDATAEAQPHAVNS